MTEIARRLDYPPSSTSALLKSLLDLGYLDCDRRARTYVPTAQISLVGGWVRNRAGGDLETIAQALHEATRLTTFIASRNQLYSQYIRVIQGTTSVRFYLEPGGLRLLPVHARARVLSQIRRGCEATAALPLKGSMLAAASALDMIAARAAPAMVTPRAPRDRSPPRRRGRRSHAVRTDARCAGVCRRSTTRRREETWACVRADLTKPTTRTPHDARRCSRG